MQIKSKRVLSVSPLLQRKWFTLTATSDVDDPALYSPTTPHHHACTSTASPTRSPQAPPFNMAWWSFILFYLNVQVCLCLCLFVSVCLSLSLPHPATCWHTQPTLITLFVMGKLLLFYMFSANEVNSRNTTTTINEELLSMMLKVGIIKQREGTTPCHPWGPP